MDRRTIGNNYYPTRTRIKNSRKEKFSVDLEPVGRGCLGGLDRKFVFLRRYIYCVYFLIFVIIGLFLYSNYIICILLKLEGSFLFNINDFAFPCWYLGLLLFSGTCV